MVREQPAAAGVEILGMRLDDHVRLALREQPLRATDRGQIKLVQKRDKKEEKSG